MEDYMSLCQNIAPLTGRSVRITCEEHHHPDPVTMTTVHDIVATGTTVYQSHVTPEETHTLMLYPHDDYEWGYPDYDYEWCDDGYGEKRKVKRGAQC